MIREIKSNDIHNSQFMLISSASIWNWQTVGMPHMTFTLTAYKLLREGDARKVNTGQ